jgi:soluble lytic murein transglycosylase
MGGVGWALGCWLLSASSVVSGPDVAVHEAEVTLRDGVEDLAAAAARAEWEEELRLLRQAEGLGVTWAVEASGLTPRQQRAVSIAIVREAERNGLDPLLIVAVIRTESSFDSYAVSGVGAMGLMQVMPHTGRYLLSKRGQRLLRKTLLFDPELNVELGAGYLADLIRRFGSVEHALVAYNAGPSLARRILRERASRERFLAGYPNKVVTLHKRLRARTASLAGTKGPTTGEQGS